MTILLLAFPWIAVLVFLVLFTRIPSELPPADALDPERALRVSVVIPERNEAVNIENCLSSIAASTYPDFEIIVVDNGSTDRTAQLARDSGARVVEEPRKGYGSACLAGIAAVDAPDIVAFLDPLLAPPVQQELAGPADARTHDVLADVSPLLLQFDENRSVRQGSVAIDHTQVGAARFAG